MIWAFNSEIQCNYNMGHPNPTALLTAVLGLFLVVVANADKALIETTCNRTSFPADCVAGLESDARSLTAESATGLGRIAVQTLGSKIRRVLGVVSEQVVKARDYAEWAKLAACKDFYSVTPVAVGSVLQAFDRRRYDVAYGGLVNVSANVDGCRAFNVPDIAQENEMVFRFTNVSITLIDLLY